MAPIRSSPAISRTRPTKRVTPPIPCRPLVREASSAPTSKSSRCTRIIASPPGHRREEGHLIIAPDRVVEADITLIDGDPDHRRILEGFGELRAAAFEPVDERLDRRHVGRRVEHLLGDADLGADPGEIEHPHGHSLLAYCARKPPSTAMVSPVMRLEARQLRKITAPTTSSTSPITPMGVASSILARVSGWLRIVLVRGVWMKVGATPLTRIPCLAHSTASVRVIFTTAP